MVNPEESIKFDKELFNKIMLEEEEVDHIKQAIAISFWAEDKEDAIEKGK